MDIVALGAAKAGAKKYTDDALQSVGAGYTFKGYVAAVSDLPAASSSNVGWEYIVGDLGSYASTGTEWKPSTRRGEKGNKGDDGISPEAAVSKTGSVATITITDAEGTTTAQISDGAKGDKGEPGDVSEVKLNGTSVVDASGTANITVAPNESAAATHTLQKLKIGSTQYKLGGAALSADSYSALVTMFNSMIAESYDNGQSVYIKTLNVPDLWIYSNNESTSVQYTYVSDAQFIADMASAGGALQIGYYKFAQLEGEKIDLTNYVQKTDTPSVSAAGPIKIGPRVSGTSYASGVFTYVAET